MAEALNRARHVYRIRSLSASMVVTWIGEPDSGTAREREACRKRLGKSLYKMTRGPSSKFYHQIKGGCEAFRDAMLRRRRNTEIHWGDYLGPGV